MLFRSAWLSSTRICDERGLETLTEPRTGCRPLACILYAVDPNQSAFGGPSGPRLANLPNPPFHKPSGLRWAEPSVYILRTYRPALRRLHLVEPGPCCTASLGCPTSRDLGLRAACIRHIGHRRGE